jgi:GNAT superfamily N-acetyltransferase
MNVLLRKATPDDAVAVANILIASRKVFLPFAPSPHSAASIHAWVAGKLLPDGGTTVAELDGEVIGILAISQHDNVQWIDQLYLDPAHVGKGVGKKLLMHAFNLLARPIRLYTFQENMCARKFYEQHGFVAIELTDGSMNEEKCPDVLYEITSSDKS